MAHQAEHLSSKPAAAIPLPAQRATAAPESPRVVRFHALRQLADRHRQSLPAVQLAARAAPAPPVQRQANRTGLPDRLKMGIENLSGLGMDDVRVHYNSPQPAQLQAHAFAQGTDIHLAPGQERHLPHEAWHVVQQKQGRVRPATQLRGKVPINDDRGLEREADVMGARAVARDTATQAKPIATNSTNSPLVRQLRLQPQAKFAELNATEAEGEVKNRIRQRADFRNLQTRLGAYETLRESGDPVTEPAQVALYWTRFNEVKDLADQILVDVHVEIFSSAKLDGTEQGLADQIAALQKGERSAGWNSIAEERQEIDNIARLPELMGRVRVYLEGREVINQRHLADSTLSNDVLIAALFPRNSIREVADIFAAMPPLAREAITAFVDRIPEYPWTLLHVVQRFADRSVKGPVQDYVPDGGPEAPGLAGIKARMKGWSWTLRHYKTHAATGAGDFVPPDFTDLRSSLSLTLGGIDTASTYGKDVLKVGNIGFVFFVIAVNGATRAPEFIPSPRIYVEKNMSDFPQMFMSRDVITYVGLDAPTPVRSYRGSGEKVRGQLIDAYLDSALSPGRAFVINPQAFIDWLYAAFESPEVKIPSAVSIRPGDWQRE